MKKFLVPILGLVASVIVIYFSFQGKAEDKEVHSLLRANASIVKMEYLSNGHFPESLDSVEHVTSPNWKLDLVSSGTKFKLCAISASDQSIAYELMGDNSDKSASEEIRKVEATQCAQPLS